VCSGVSEGVGRIEGGEGEKREEGGGGWGGSIGEVGRGRVSLRKCSSLKNIKRSGNQNSALVREKNIGEGVKHDSATEKEIKALGFEANRFGGELIAEEEGRGSLEVRVKYPIHPKDEGVGGWGEGEMENGMTKLQEEDGQRKRTAGGERKVSVLRGG